MQFDFLVLLVINFRLVVIFLLVVRGSKGFLPTPPSWPELQFVLNPFTPFIQFPSHLRGRSFDLWQYFSSTRLVHEKKIFFLLSLEDWIIEDFSWWYWIQQPQVSKKFCGNWRILGLGEGAFPGKGRSKRWLQTSAPGASESHRGR